MPQGIISPPHTHGEEMISTCDFDKAPSGLSSRFAGCTRVKGHSGPCAHPLKGKRFVTKRERMIWETSGWRLPVFWLYREVLIRIYCFALGHRREFGAFVPVVVCTRCRRVIDAPPAPHTEKK